VLGIHIRRIWQGIRDLDHHQKDER
jgi:hypothetical protein